MSPRSSDSHPMLAPTRALLHPLWLGSLAVLVLNDHVLKGASILPEAVTGKLSDFAGLIVAPVLLAALLRVTTRRGWLASHVAVGIGFAAIQLSAAAAAGWSAAMEMIGFGWLITRDATDLVALPALLVSAWGLRRAMERRPSSSARRSIEVAAAGTGLLCCAATSPAPGEEFVPDLFTDIYFHNAGADPIVVRVRELSPSVDVDCNVLAENPGALATEPLFGGSQSYRLDPDQNFGLRVGDGGWNEWGTDGDWEEENTGTPRDCNAALLDIDGLPPAVLFWFDGRIPTRNVPGFGAEEGEARGRIELHPSGNPDTLGEYVSPSEEILHLVPAATPPVVGACAPQSDAGRLYWSEPLPTGNWELDTIDRGADGCYAMDLVIRNPVDEILDEARWYLCAPLSHLGFEPGRRIRIESLGAGFGGGSGVLVTTVDGTEQSPVPEREPTLVELQAFRGSTFPAFRGLQVAAVPEFDCGHAVAETCGTVTRATTVSAGGGAFEVTQMQHGDVQTLAGSEGDMTIALAHAEERAVLDPECAEGPDTLGLDLEVVALYIEP